MKCDSCGNTSDFERHGSAVHCGFCGRAMSLDEPSGRANAPSQVQPVDDESRHVALLLPLFEAWSVEHKSAFLAPDIPEPKLKGFLGACEDGGIADDLQAAASSRGHEPVNGIVAVRSGIFALVDCTLFGGARESVALTWAGLVSKTLAEDAVLLGWGELANANAAGPCAKSIGILNPIVEAAGRKIDFSGSSLGSTEMNVLVNRLNQIH